MQTITKFSSLHDSNQQSDTNAYSLVPATPSCSKFLYKNVVHFYILQYSLRTNVTHTLLSRIITTNILTNILQLCITKTYIDNVPYLTPLLAAEVWHKCNRNSFRSFANFSTDREAIFLRISEYFSHIAEPTSYIAHVMPRRANIIAHVIWGSLLRPQIILNTSDFVPL